MRRKGDARVEGGEPSGTRRDGDELLKAKRDAGSGEWGSGFWRRKASCIGILSSVSASHSRSTVVSTKNPC